MRVKKQREEGESRFVTDASTSLSNNRYTLAANEISRLQIPSSSLRQNAKHNKWDRLTAHHIEFSTGIAILLPHQ